MDLISLIDKSKSRLLPPHVGYIQRIKITLLKPEKDNCTILMPCPKFILINSSTNSNT